MTQPTLPGIIANPQARRIAELEAQLAIAYEQIDRLVELLGYDPVLMEQIDPAAGVDDEQRVAGRGWNG